MIPTSPSGLRDQNESSRRIAGLRPWVWVVVLSPVLIPTAVLLVAVAVSLSAASWYWVLLVVRPLLALVAVSWLILAARRYTRRLARFASAFALIIALTLAQPFGIHAVRVAAPPAGAEPVSPRSALDFRVAGWVPVSASLYTTGLLHGDSGEPQGTLRLDSSVWGPVLFSTTAVTEICGATTPCWAPDPSSTADGLQAVTKDGRYWLVYRSNGVAVVNHATWSLRFGLTSWLGLAYWCCVAVLLAYLALIARLERR